MRNLNEYKNVACIKMKRKDEERTITRECVAAGKAGNNSKKEKDKMIN